MLLLPTAKLAVLQRKNKMQNLMAHNQALMAGEYAFSIILSYERKGALHKSI